MSFLNSIFPCYYTTVKNENEITVNTSTSGSIPSLPSIDLKIYSNIRQILTCHKNNFARNVQSAIFISLHKDQKDLKDAIHQETQNHYEACVQEVKELLSKKNIPAPKFNLVNRKEFEELQEELISQLSTS